MRASASINSMRGEMQLVIAQLVGVVVFCVGVLMLGLWLRRRPSVDVARTISAISHGLFHAGLSVPMVWGLFWPSIARFDVIVGLPSLLVPAVREVLGGGLLLVGFYFASLSMVGLLKWGWGLASFVLSQRVVEMSLYQRVRNPMALGWYLMCLGVGCCARSTYLMLYLLLGHIPSNIFFLKFFEERELELRFGESYTAYRRHIPFLIPRWRPAP
jgi:protein-S-isoprenylcysteine O-methyltransferase Ste14